jgi:hypothetical protein
MSGYNVPTDLRSDWAAQIEADLEAGQSPLLNLGAGNGLLENLPALVALHAFAAGRHDLAAPTVLVGGNPLLWLAALLHTADGIGSHSPPFTLLYSGPDLATQIASSGAIMAAHQLVQQPHELPAAWTTLLAPGRQAGAPLWETLPLAVAQSTTPAPAEPDDPWLAWGGLSLALLLVILGLAL